MLMGRGRELPRVCAWWWSARSQACCTVSQSSTDDGLAGMPVGTPRSMGGWLHAQPALDDGHPRLAQRAASCHRPASAGGHPDSHAWQQQQLAGRPCDCGSRFLAARLASRLGARSVPPSIPVGARMACPVPGLCCRARRQPPSCRHLSAGPTTPPVPTARGALHAAAAHREKNGAAAHPSACVAPRDAFRRRPRPRPAPRWLGGAVPAQKPWLPRLPLALPSPLYSTLLYSTLLLERGGRVTPSCEGGPRHLSLPRV